MCLLLCSVYLLMNMDVRLFWWTSCSVPAQELHLFEHLFDCEGYEGILQ